jgi:hypothetical protein
MHPACRCAVWRPPDVRGAYAPGLVQPLQTSKPTPSTFTRTSSGQTLVVGAKLEHSARAYQQLVLKVNSIDTTFTGAFHMDRAPMTLLGTAGSSQEALPVMRHRVYMSDNGDRVRWVGELQQPHIHDIYRSHFNDVDVHSKLSVGPRSMCETNTYFSETNTYLLYVQHHKLSSEAYSRPDFKLQLERG